MFPRSIVAIGARPATHNFVPEFRMRHSALGLNLREKLIDLGQNALNDAVDSLGVGMDGVFLHEASVERDTIEEEGIEHRAVAFCEIGIDRAELIDIILA